MHRIDMSINSVSEEASPTPDQGFLESGSSLSSRCRQNGTCEASPALISAHKKVDRRLILWYSVVYLVMRVHVSNISNTAIINLEQGDGIKKREWPMLSST